MPQFDEHDAGVLEAGATSGPARITVAGEMIREAIAGGASPEFAAAFTAMWVASSVAASAGVDRKRWMALAELAFAAALAPEDRLQAVLQELQAFEAENALTAAVKPWGAREERGDGGRGERRC